MTPKSTTSPLLADPPPSWRARLRSSKVGRVIPNVPSQTSVRSERGGLRISLPTFRSRFLVQPNAPFCFRRFLPFGLSLGVALALSAGCTTASFKAEDKAIARFYFGDHGQYPGWTHVPPSTIYSSERGYGFEPGANVETYGAPLLPGESHPATAGGVVSNAPFYFSVALPEGNYRVTVTLSLLMGHPMTIKAELRRLMLENVRTSGGLTSTHSFIVNLRRPQIAGTDRQVRLKNREKAEEAWAWDEKLTLEFNGKQPCVAAIEIARADEVPTFFLLGDSTVADQPREPFASWGQMLPRFFKPSIVIANHSESGESVSSAIAELRLEKVLSVARPGDWVAVQFGHNDMKSQDVPTYKANLQKMTAALREKGLSTILVTPMNRRRFDAEGRALNSHGDYPESVREVAREENLPLVDLHAMSLSFHDALGAEKSLLAFKTGDGTHHNAYGAYQLAKCVVESLRQQRLRVARHLIDDLPAFDPAQPDAPETFSLPPSPTASGAKPDGS